MTRVAILILVAAATWAAVNYRAVRELPMLVERIKSPEDGRGVVCAMTDRGWLLLQNVAPTHVRGVRENLVDLVSAEDFAALGRVMDTVADHLIAGHPEMEMRRPRR